MADIKNKNELKRRIELFIDELDYSINEDFCKETMKMMREFIGHTSHQLDCKNAKIDSLNRKLKDYSILEKNGMHGKSDMSGLELLLEHLSKQKKAYDRLDVCGLSSEDDKCRKIIMADSIIHNQSMIIEKLIKADMIESDCSKVGRETRLGNIHEIKKQAFLSGIEASKTIEWTNESEEIERVLKEWGIE